MKRTVISCGGSAPPAIRHWTVIYWAITLVAFVLPFDSFAQEQPQAAPIPLKDIGAQATAGYQGDALGITPTADGARLRCGFQKIEGHATKEGLWLESTEPGATGKLRITATAVWHANPSTRNAQPPRERVSNLVGVDVSRLTSLPGTQLESPHVDSYGLAATGTISIANDLVRLTRPGIIEEYSVSVDGVRQDFVITERPSGTGDLCVELELAGARADPTATGTRLKFAGSGRELVYDRLRAQDAMGRELPARLEVVLTNRLIVIVADSDATYPVRIDPTFSDADWIVLNPSLPGANNYISAMSVDDAGNLYVGGGFTVIGNTSANYVAKWNGTAWSALGPGTDAGVFAVLVVGTNVYAGGGFANAGGEPANLIAKWDGYSWSALGAGLSGPSMYSPHVSALAIVGTNLYAAGQFSVAGDVPANRIARWDGSAWSPLGQGLNEWVTSLAVVGTNLYAGGNFAGCIARWDGSAWAPFSSVTSGGQPIVETLLVSGTDLYVGGLFEAVDEIAVTNLAKWDGAAWSSFGPGFGDRVSAIAVIGANLYAGGWGVAGKWDGTTWSYLESPVSGIIDSLAVVGTNVYVGGRWESTSDNIAKWDGDDFFPVGAGMNDGVLALAVSGTDLYVGGGFTSVGNMQVNCIAKWDGNTWSSLGAGMTAVPYDLTYWPPFIENLAVSGSEIYAAGSFTSAGATSATNIAKWDGTNWSALGQFNGRAYDLAVVGTNLYAAGWILSGEPGNIHKWDGNSWSPLMPGAAFDAYALAVSETDLYVGGSFTMAGGVPANCIARWDGKTWWPLGSGMAGTRRFSLPSVTCLAVSGSNVYAAGDFTSAGGVPAKEVARWDGSTWSALSEGLTDLSPNAFIGTLAASGSDLYVGGRFDSFGGIATHNIARWDGTKWSALGLGVRGEYGVRAVVADGVGHLFVGGSFLLAGTNVSPYLAQANLGHAPTILSSPETQTAEVGSTADFTPAVSGYLPLTYLTFFNDTNLVRWGTNCELALTDDFQTGIYRVVVTNVFGEATCAPVMLSVIPPVERRLVPAVSLTGNVGDVIDLDYADLLSLETNWSILTTATLSETSQFYFDLTEPLPQQRFYRTWQPAALGIESWLGLHIVPAITLSGNVGNTLRLDYINAIGPTDAWQVLDTVTLTNTSQLYFDTSSIDQPRRLYRIVPVP